MPPPVGTSLKTSHAHGKSPGVATGLSLVVVGLGQFYNGDKDKGLRMFCLAVVSGLISSGVLWFVVAVWSAIDAYRVAAARLRWTR
jgi:hypothetical protein